jgi:hypothetical protein
LLGLLRETPLTERQDWAEKETFFVDIGERPSFLDAGVEVTWWRTQKSMRVDIQSALRDVFLAR